MNLTPAQVLKACGWAIVCAVAFGILASNNFAGIAVGTLALPTVVPMIRDWALEHRMRRELKLWLDG